MHFILPLYIQAYYHMPVNIGKNANRLYVMKINKENLVHVDHLLQAKLGEGCSSCCCDIGKQSQLQL